VVEVLVSGYWVIIFITSPASASRIATTRVACITLPPPIASSTSAPAARAASRASTTSG